MPLKSGSSGSSSHRQVQEAVSAVVRWCRSADTPPLDQAQVPGANPHERSLLAALGGLANAFAYRRGLTDNLPDSIQNWMQAAPMPPPGIVNQIMKVLDTHPDPLALVYQRIVAGPRRRQLGTFFTPRNVVEHIGRIIQNANIICSPAAVADPGAGVGMFTTFALEQWPRAQICAVDINLVTLGLLATRPDLGAVASAAMTNRLHLFQGDFLIWLCTVWPNLAGPRLIIGNPPYTRHQNLTSTYKQKARAATGQYAPGGRAGLSTYFLAASLDALSSADSLCLLLPANWLEADYAAPVRRLLWTSQQRRVEIHSFPNTLQGVFPGAQVTAMVLMITPQMSGAQPMLFYNVLTGPNGAFRSLAQGEYERGINPPARFTHEALDKRAVSSRVRRSAIVRLSDIASIRRGVATGANKFFLRSDDQVSGFPRDILLPAISRLRDFDGRRLDESRYEELGKSGARRWLLKISRADLRIPAVVELLKEGVEAGYHLPYLCATRMHWFELEQVDPPDILIGPMSKHDFRVVLNDVGAVHTNTLYGIRLRTPHRVHAAEVLAGWLTATSGQAALRAAARQHGDGLRKLEPGAMADLAVPNWLARRIREPGATADWPPGRL